ncbi:MAG: PKD domain-containing protein [Deltaproteobacteria bacterium]|nr:PKD domain-containing protein [Deltaproteobacteria bacterium]
MEKKKLKGYGLSTVKGKEIFNIQNFQNNFSKTGRLFRDATNIKKIFTAWKSILLWIPLIFFLGVEPGYAIDATLQWSANTEPDLAGYRVFCREEGQYYNYTNPSWEGTNTICTIYDLDETKAYYFVARAFDIEELESGNSNEVYLEAAITPYNKNPIAYADPDLTSGIAPFTVTFDGSGSYDPDGEIVSYDWDFGDGTTDMGERVSYTFMDTGVYTVILTVADNQGATDSDTIRITASSGSGLEIEAEDMPIKTSGRPISGGWNLWSDGYIADTVDFPTRGIYTFEVRASGSYDKGAWPIMEVCIDQTGVGTVKVDDSIYAIYTIEADVASGMHEVAIGFANDYKPPKEKNLYVDKINIFP